ncbi:MAG: aminodeoxychorismate lyase [Gammaproteobacteria bacterium]|jgi:4-amino-4-deoxychorismate lyase
MNACLINGQMINSLAITDRAIHYGDGLFETIALKHGVMPFWSDHYQRLILACERLKFPIPNEALLLQEIDTVKHNQDKAIIKIILTRGQGERGYRIPKEQHIKRIVQAYAFPDYPKHYYEQGVQVIFCKTPVSENKTLAGIKHLNRLDNVLASSEWTDPNIAEGLMCNAKDDIIQGTKSNLFYAQGGELFTPDLSHCGILGIMRAQILTWAELHDIRVNIIPIAREKLLQADEVFLCNSIFGIWPVTNIEGRLLKVGHYTQKLIQYFG